MPLDPEFLAEVNRLLELGMPNAAGLGISAARAELAGFREIQDPPRQMRELHDLLIPGHGGSIPIRMYIPETAPPSAPAILYFHGGGWVIGNIEVADRMCRDLAAIAGCVVVSVDYRLAPETKFPGPLMDCYTAAMWLSDNAERYGINPQAIALSGDSAGGNLAACVGLKARDEGAPAIAYLALVYPTCSTGISPSLGAQDGPGTAIVPVRGSDQMDWYRDRYLRTDADLLDPYAVPLAAASLGGLPPTLVVSCRWDRLIDENTELVARIRRDGGDVQHEIFEKEIHSFMWLGVSTSAGYEDLLGLIATGLHRAIGARVA
ncbi:alpha/beta hydrolase [Mycobacterium sp. 94-17]|uniref:alpha/beta hydrolase n=1 Tax=Mycobacterium sp. 94-17 TaxID=2986147 RepID=UPI002D1EDC79|nr:alpha/beta hydrolase [Mycobacterium sp. 94-17]MEB4209744.1 alpha/beta hydrolase [Mycobacterium sp. 94-17]